MGTDKSRRKFLGRVGAAALASGLPLGGLASEARSSQGQARGRRDRRGADDPVLRPFGFVIHGGAGTLDRSRMTPERESAYHAALTQALTAGHSVLQRGGGGLDAVIAAITILEDSPLFNAGRGAVFTSAGTNELDASIMDGRTLRAGAVAGLKHIKNPITLARLVMEQSKHVMMVGEGAETFARQQGMELVDEKYFHTEERMQQLRRVQEEEKEKERLQPPKPPKTSERGGEGWFHGEEKFGTVGAVCLDRAGNLSAGTSTGGMTNKRFGRVGDSPIIGAGTYANNQTCAVSATGDGEYFIRTVVAHDISALMEYGGRSLRQAAELVLEKVGRLGGGGGLIAIDRGGRIAMPFNTTGMYRGFIGPEGQPRVMIFRD
jgi:beta-aspartyl-peptidase (threonine type)